MKYRVTSYVKIELVTVIEAKSAKEAERIGNEEERDISICIHGSEYETGQASGEEWVAVDACTYDVPVVDDVMRLKDWKS